MNVGNVSIDPEFKSLIRPLSDDERAALTADLLAHGCLDAIKVWNGLIVDGHNRHEICAEHGIPFATHALGFAGRDDAKLWILRHQLGRRNLTTGERLALASQYQDLVASKSARERQGRRTDLLEGDDEDGSTSGPIGHEVSRARDEAAQVFGVSPRALERFRAVEREAVPELLEAVRRDEVAVSAAVEVARLPVEEQLAVVEAGPEAVREKAAEVREERKRAHVANNSGNNEWYTPPQYIEAARRAMGSIDTDPASSDVAQETVRADVYYTADEDGLVQTWAGNVWMNPPYSQPLVAQFAEAVVAKYAAGEISAACVLVNNATETAWFQTMLDAASAVCLLRGRVKFLDPVGNPSGAPLQGQVVIYLGRSPDAFALEFLALGSVLFAEGVARAA